jgi:hypothetical protein
LAQNEKILDFSNWNFDISELSAQKSNTYTIELQGSFSLNEYYPSVAIEKSLKGSNPLARNSNLKLTLGGGFLGSKKYATLGFACDSTHNTRTSQTEFALPYTYSFYYPFPEYAKESQSVYTGIVIKLSHLNTFHQKKMTTKLFRISGGFDVGYYFLNDSYKITVVNPYTKVERSIVGNFRSGAVSAGATVDLKKGIGKNFYLNCFGQFMFYFNNWPNKQFIYEFTSPYAYWKFEAGVGIGWTFYR